MRSGAGALWVLCSQGSGNPFKEITPGISCRCHSGPMRACVAYVPISPQPLGRVTEDAIAFCTRVDVCLCLSRADCVHERGQIFKFIRFMRLKIMRVLCLGACVRLCCFVWCWSLSIIGRNVLRMRTREGRWSWMRHRITTATRTANACCWRAAKCGVQWEVAYDGNEIMMLCSWVSFLLQTCVIWMYNCVCMCAGVRVVCTICKLFRRNLECPKCPLSIFNFNHITY